MAQKRCHRHRPEDLTDGVPGSQQGDGAGESEQASGRQGHRADPDEGGPEEDCAEKSRDRTAGTRAGSAIPKACRSSAPASRVGCDHRAHSHAHSAADGIAAKPTTSQAPLPSQPGESLFDGRDQERAGDDVPDSLEGVADE